MSMTAFEAKGPRLLPEEFLVGRLEGWGIIESALGNLQKRCTISAEGTLDATSGVVSFSEIWRFDDGHTDRIAWQIRKIGEGRYAGREPSVANEAEGEQAGFAFRWRYTRDTPQGDGSSLTLNFDDWFYRIDERVCIVRGSAGRLGLPFLSVFVTYRRL